MRRSHVWLAAGGLVAALAAPGLLAAQGFSVNEHSTCAMGRAGTGAALPCPDGSAMAFNPGGLASLGKGQGVVTANATIIAARGSYTNSATGFKDDLELNLAEWVVYDALYAFCQAVVEKPAVAR